MQAVEDSLKANDSNNAGTSSPSYAVEGSSWYDTANKIMKLYNGSSWISGGSGAIVGEVKSFAMSSNPSGWLTCDGSAISRTTYAALFAAIGTTYGAGDGSTTFNLPDAQGRTIIGDGSGSGLTARTIADSSGAETHQLTESEMPSHTHDIIGASDATTGGVATRPNGINVDTTTTSNSTGGDTAHNNMQPFLCLRYAIYAGV